MALRLIVPASFGMLFAEAPSPTRSSPKKMYFDLRAASVPRRRNRARSRGVSADGFSSAPETTTVRPFPGSSTGAIVTSSVTAFPMRERFPVRT